MFFEIFSFSFLFSTQNLQQRTKQKKFKMSEETINQFIDDLEELSLKDKCKQIQLLLNSIRENLPKNTIITKTNEIKQLKETCSSLTSCQAEILNILPLKSQMECLKKMPVQLGKQVTPQKLEILTPNPFPINIMTFNLQMLIHTSNSRIQRIADIVHAKGINIFCAQEIKAALQEKKTAALERIKMNKKTIAEIDDKICDIKESIVDFKESLKAQEKKIKEKKKELQVLNKTGNNNKKIKKIKDDIEDLKGYADDIEEEIEYWKQKISEYQENIKTYNDKIAQDEKVEFQTSEKILNELKNKTKKEWHYCQIESGQGYQGNECYAIFYTDEFKKINHESLKTTFFARDPQVLRLKIKATKQYLTIHNFHLSYVNKQNLKNETKELKKIIEECEQSDLNLFVGDFNQSYEDIRKKIKTDKFDKIGCTTENPTITTNHYDFVVALYPKDSKPKHSYEEIPIEIDEVKLGNGQTISDHLPAAFSLRLPKNNVSSKK